MDARRIGQALVVSPEVPFTHIARALERIGFVRAPRAEPAAPSLIEGEPELAAFTWRGEKPYVNYTFNPVVRLRVLDVATLPPNLRASIAAALTLTSAPEVEPLLSAPEPRQRLRALWVARETERLDLLPAIERAHGDAERAVAAAAEQTASALRQVLEARMATLAQLQVLCESAKEFLPRLADPSVTAGLRPAREDYAKLFDRALAPAVEAAVEAAWQRPPTANPGSGYAGLDVTATTAGLLRWSNELSERFPTGYREIAGWMVPSRIWLSWRWQTSAGPGVHYDGLAWLDDHWVWIPKAYRILGPIIGARLGLQSDPKRVLH